jgi:hypothetical protein
MIVNDAPVNTVESNATTVNEFRIRSSAKSFALLSDGLYSNSTEAIVRELSCNAYDSHVAAKCPTKPFELHLPTALEPWFAVRDFGTGLDHTEVIDIYTTYFESTKSQSNDFVGALGLGSKSPFSYTDNFAVTATKDGITRLYSAFINDNGVPSIALMHEAETAEQNSVEVRFGVSESDFRRFWNAAAVVLTHFDVKPVMTGHDVDIKEVAYAEKDIIPGVHICEQVRSGNRIVMGNISYPISSDQIEQYVNSTENEGDSDSERQAALNAIRLLDFKRIEINCPIGSVQFQPSREHLKYVPSTCEYIINTLKQVNSKLLESLERRLAQHTTQWDLKKDIAAMAGDNWFKIPLSSYVNNLNDSSVAIVHQSGWRKGEVQITPYELNVSELENNNIRINILEYTHNGVKEHKPNRHVDDNGATTTTYKISPTIALGIVTNDTKLGAITRTKYHMRSNHGNLVKDGAAFRANYVIVLSAIDTSKPADFSIVNKKLGDFSESFCTVLSALDKKVRKAAVATGKMPILKLRQSSSYSRHNSIDRNYVWQPIEVDSSDTREFLYVPLSGFDICDSKIASRFKENCELAVKLNLLNQNQVIVGVRKSHWDEVKRNKQFKLFSEFLEESTDAIKEAAKKYALTVACNKAEVDHTDFKHVGKYLKKQYPGKFNDIADLLNDHPVAITAHQARYEYNNTFTFKLVLKYAEKSIDRYVKELEKYPLLKILRYTYRDEEVKLIADYIVANS